MMMAGGLFFTVISMGFSCMLLRDGNQFLLVRSVFCEIGLSGLEYERGKCAAFEQQRNVLKSSIEIFFFIPFLGKIPFTVQLG